MTRHNDHIRAEDLMSAYLDQQVTAEEKQFLEQHVAACADCRAQLEATRSMIAALKALPAVKAPRSFVLPREMAKQPKRSTFNWYPALRLATAVAAIAFAILFASDVLINRSGSGLSGMASLPARAPAPLSTAVTAAQSTEAFAPPQAPAAAPTTTAAAMAAESQPSAVAGAAAKAPTISNTTPLSEATTMLAAPPTPTTTPEPTTIAAQPAPTSAPAANAAADQAQRLAERSAPTPAAPATDPLRLIEIALLGLVIVLGVATFFARRRQA